MHGKRAATVRRDSCPVLSVTSGRRVNQSANARRLFQRINRGRFASSPSVRDSLGSSKRKSSTVLFLFLAFILLLLQEDNMLLVCSAFSGSEQALFIKGWKEEESESSAFAGVTGRISPAAVSSSSSPPPHNELLHCSSRRREKFVNAKANPSGVSLLP